MTLSLNQVEQTTRKAVRGAGLPWGLAEDAGRAVRWLERMGLPGMSWLTLVLDAMDHGRIGELLIRRQGTVWRGAAGAVSPLLAGPSLADAMHLHRREPGLVLTLRAVACPELCAGYLGVASLQTRVPLAMSWIRGDLWICAERVILDGAHGAEVTADRQDLTVCVGSAEPGTAGMELTPTAGSRRIEPCALGRLESLARRTYVDNTEASRRSGAGAGLGDSD